MWKDKLETVIENNERTFSNENKYYYWLRYNRLKKIISMNPYKNLESENMKIDEMRDFLI